MMRVLRTFLALALLASTAAQADELDSLAQAIDRNPDDKAAYDAYANAALRAKRYDDAIRKLKVGVARIPDYADGYYKLGYAFRQKKEWADAADYYRRYIAIDPQRTDTYYGLGAALEGLGDDKGAIAAYGRYVMLEHSPAKQRFIDEAKAELARLQGQAGPPPPVQTQPPVALPARDQQVPPQSAPSVTPAPVKPDAGALRAEAEALRTQGKLREAAAAYKRAIDADPKNLDVYNDLGNVYFSLKQYDDAAKAFGDATRKDPNYALGWYNLAHALRKSNRAREAADAYRQYIRLKPDDPDPYYGLGETLKMMGDTKGAIDAFKRYVTMEQRPSEQQWVQKARSEMQALEAMQARPAAQPTGKIEEKSTGDDGARKQLDEELHRDAVMPPSDDDMRLIDPFRGSRMRDLKDPFTPGDELSNPFERAPSASLERLREYGVALAAYRRALARHAEDVSLRFERGVASALAANASSTLRAWNTVPLEDNDVRVAAQSVERIRKQLLTAKR